VKYCPNPECRYVVRHHEAQEYRDEAVTCADCGAELTTERPVPPAIAGPRELPWLKLALTVLVPLVVVWLAPQVLLPRIDWDALHARFGQNIGGAGFSVFTLGLYPVISASLLVELAALAVPRWRPLRTAGPAGRSRLLVATGWLSLVLASVQAMGVAAYLERMGALRPDTRLSRLVVFLSLIVGTAVLVAVTRLLDRAALGGGFSLLITAFSLSLAWPALRQLGEEAWGLNSSGSGRMLLVGGPLLLAGAATAFLLRWRPASSLRLPACGLVPFHFVAAAVTLGALGMWPESVRAIAERGDVAGLVFRLALTAGFAVGLGFLFNPPSKVAAFAPDAPRRVRRAVILSVAYVVGLGILAELLGRQFELLSFNLTPVAMAVAVGLDVFAEADAIRRHGDLVTVWPEHRLYAVDSALEALDGDGIPGLAGSVHVRALWHFFAPLIPVRIMVPRARPEDAARVLHRHAAGHAFGAVFD
jgi:hypothetical protein